MPPHSPAEREVQAAVPSAEARLALVVVGERAALRAADGTHRVVGAATDVLVEAARLERELRPRWVVPCAAHSLRPLVHAGVRVQRAFDIAEAHRVIYGGWLADLPRAYGAAHGLDLSHLPALDSPSGPDLFSALEPVDPAAGQEAIDPDDPVLAGGYLRPDVLEPGWADGSDERMDRLAVVVLEVAERQVAALRLLGPRGPGTAHSEAAAAVLCLELERDGLPVDRAVAEELVARSAGPRPTSPADAAAIRRRRDDEVQRLAPGRPEADLRNPVQVRQLLASVGVVVPTTRAGVLDPYRTTHPLVEALLRWRKDERIATTYGYRWLDEDVGADGRLRGAWTACDGAAGRMTAQHGLHNLPAPLRPAVVAEPGHVFVRADLGQVEPRVLAVVSGDRGLAEATRSDDLYAPVAQRLGVERPIAKVAVLAAMYGARSGAAGQALAGLQRAYPVAMRLLDDAYESGRTRRPLRTYGGRLIPLDAMLTGSDRPQHDPTEARPRRGDDEGSDPVRVGEQRDAARGRFARNAIIQGSAAELFKAWAATVRHELAGLDCPRAAAQIVLCLHDELLVHAAERHADAVEEILHRALTDSARRWAASTPVSGPVSAPVRFVAETAIVRRWSDAKA